MKQILATYRCRKALNYKVSEDFEADTVQLEDVSESVRRALSACGLMTPRKEGCHKLANRKESTS